MPNRLIDSTSPYLLQHAHNPVDWNPWDVEALERARREDKPIFLSIGYAACHWCHVMERECFENPGIAGVMNEHFVNIKVDREERPDLDDLYMLATQLMTGQGGWPMSVWLTPTLEPFYAGTYFPPTDAHGRPGFPRLLAALHDAWQNRRADLLAQSQKVVEAVRMHADESQKGELETGDAKRETPQLLRLAIEQFSDRFDEVNGGLGSAPKFPPHQALQLWLAILTTGDAARTGLSGPEQRILAHKLALTLDGMKNGGIYDHVGGGFARYSTDEHWLVPHFEKMLYDNAQLAPVYAHASVLFNNPEYARIARETLDFFLREMCADTGAFYSSLDADSEGAEGKYYVWTPDDIRGAIANDADATLIGNHFGITEHSNWHESPVEHASVLAIAKSPEDLGTTQFHIDKLVAQMRLYRNHRPRPRLDDKILTSWNGLMLSALAITGRILQDTTYLRAAQHLAAFLLTHHLTPAGLQRVSRHDAPAHTPAFLDDYAFLLNGLLDLLEAVPEEAAALQPAALQLADTLLHDFQDQAHGGFFFTGPRHEQLFARMKNAADNATPSANGVAIRALFHLSRLTGDPAYRDAALRAVAAFHPHIARRPEYFPTILLGLLEDADTDTAAAPAIENRKSKIEDQASLTLSHEPLPVLAPGTSFEVIVHVIIAAGYHIQPPDADDAVRTAARVRSTGAPILASLEWHYPPTQSIHDTVGYAGTIDIRAACTLLPDARLGNHILRATVSAQPCTATACLAPVQVTLEIPLTIQSP